MVCVSVFSVLHNFILKSSFIKETRKNISHSANVYLCAHAFKCHCIELRTISMWVVVYMVFAPTSSNRQKAPGAYPIWHTIRIIRNKELELNTTIATTMHVHTAHTFTPTHAQIQGILQDYSLMNSFERTLLKETNPNNSF